MHWCNFRKTISDVIPRAPQSDLFSEINGREREKAILKSILYASKPVHALLAGPPHAGKTIFLEAIQRYFGRRAVYNDFTSTSKAGTMNDIITQKPKYYLADEIEKADKPTRSGLLNVMHNGTITYKLKKKSIETKVLVSIIGTCNHMEELESTQPEFIDRMQVIHVSPYSEEEYLQTCVFRLARDGIKADLAQYIGNAVFAEWGTNLRKCVDIAAMAKTQEDVDDLIKNMVELGEPQ